MKYLHDVWVNWSDGGSRAHQIPEYHEWRKDDYVELMDQIPVIVLEPESFTVLEDGYVDIPKEILEMVFKQAARINPETKRRNKVEYAFIITDKTRVLAINTESDTKPNLKSRLLPRQENFTTEMVEFDEPLPVKVVADEYEDGEVEEILGDDILSLKPEYMIGLTRDEKEMKEMVMDCLFNISCSEDYHEVYYWYVELFPKEYNPAVELEMDDMVQKMFDLLKVGWTQQHVDFGTQLIKAYDIYKEDWAAIIKKIKHKDKVEA
jgi:hypothetical protein